MNTFIFLLLVVAPFSTAFADVQTNVSDVYHNPMDQKLLSLLEKCKTMMKHGHEQLGIPVLDPFKLNETSFVVDEAGSFNVNASLENLRVDRLSEYNVKAAKFQMVGLNISMTLHWPHIFAETKYKVKGLMGTRFSIFGSGDLSLNIQDLVVDVSLTITMNDKRWIQIKEMISHISMKKFKFEATGLYNDDEVSNLLSAIISDMAPEMLTVYQDDVTNFINVRLMKLINGLLEGVQPNTLLEMLTPH